MKFHSTFLVLLVATTFRTWFTDVLVQASQVSSSNEAETAAQTAGVGSELPGLPVRTSKGEKDMKHPILNMEDPDYKDPEPCIGLTCPLTGEQY